LAEIPKSNQNNKHSEATADGRNIGEASENEAEHATQKPIHPNETVEHEPKVDSEKEHLDEVKEHANKKPSLSTSDADLLVEEQSILDEESYVPVKLHHQEVPEDDPKSESCKTPRRMRKTKCRYQMRTPEWMKLPITGLLFQRLHVGRKNDMLRLQS
jgi:hypothetical protein